MKKISQICVLLFMHLPNDALANPINEVPLSSIHPCHLVYHGRHFRNINPNLPDLPLSHGENFPIRFYLHTSIPQQHRPIVHAAATELNMKVGFQMIAIQSEIDRGINSYWKDSKNVIYWDDYWANSGGIESSERIRALEAAATFIDPTHAHGSSYITISEVDIFIYGEKPNTAIGLLRIMFNQSLRRLGIEQRQEDIDLKSLQNMLIEHLSNTDSEGFYDMIIQLMHDKGIRTSNASRANIQDWIINTINVERRNIEPLISFEDLQDLLIEEFSVELNQFNNSIVLKNHVLHEFGHAVGLSHNENVKSLMADGLDITPVPTVPKDLLFQNEFDNLAMHGLKCLYDLDRLRQIIPL